MKSLLPPELQPAWDVRDTKPRRERLAELAFAGYRIPRCGLFRDMVRLGVPLVVYMDDLAHCGEGKVLVKPGYKNADKFAPYFCSEYVPDDLDDDTVSTVHSHRELVVGDYRFILSYWSSSSWKSNVGGDCKLISRVPGRRAMSDGDCLMPYPMYAVDYTNHGEGFYHFDLNVYPGVPVEVVNMVGRGVLQDSVAAFCRERGLI